MLRSRKKQVQQDKGFAVGGAIKPLDYLRREYYSDISKLVRAMIDDMRYSIEHMYEHREDDITFDGNPVNDLNGLLNYKYRKWKKRFNKHARRIAQKHIDSTDEAVTGALERSITKAAPDFTMRGDSRDLLMRKKSIIDANVDLITDLPEQLYKDIQGDMQRALQFGNDADALNKMLIARGIQCRNRVALITKDQISKATAVLSTQRALDNGIKYAVWRHSNGGAKPRKSHQEADGMIFELAKGCLIDGEYILPGTLINCDCFRQVIIGEPELPARVSQ